MCKAGDEVFGVFGGILGAIGFVATFVIYLFPNIKFEYRLVISLSMWLLLVFVFAIYLVVKVYTLNKQSQTKIKELEDKNKDVEAKRKALLKSFRKLNQRQIHTDVVLKNLVTVFWMLEIRPSNDDTKDFMSILRKFTAEQLELLDKEETEHE